jgi:hypothetical protein
MVFIGNVKEQAPAMCMAQAKPGYQAAGLSLQLRLFALNQVVARNINQFFAIKCYQGII